MTRVNSPLQHALCALARATADPDGAPRDPDGAAGADRTGAGAEAAAAEPAGARALADRPDGTVVRAGRLVAKAHAPDADAAALGARIALAAHHAFDGVLLAPEVLPNSLSRSPHGTTSAAGPGAPGGPSRTLARLPGGRLASVWPYGAPVDPACPDAAPWEEAGALLARLHTPPPQLPLPAPPMRGPAKAARALERMRRAVAAGAPGPHTSGAAAVEAAWAVLPAWCRDEAPPPRATALCHGDFHLGQLVRHPAPDGPWRLIDVDDLGIGDPAWDLARPASWYATGLLPPSDWERFLGAYARGWETAQAREFGDPWPQLEAPAAALTVQTAALALAKATAAGRALDEAEEACVDACARIAALRTGAELAAFQGS